MLVGAALVRVATGVEEVEGAPRKLMVRRKGWGASGGGVGRGRC